MNEDFYAILEITKEASQDDIKKAFRNLSKKYHPDLNPNNKEAEEKFKKINEAYSVLSDPEKKNQYDNRNNGFGNFGNINFGFGQGFDFFNDFFNQGFNFNKQQKQQNKRGSDLRIKLNLTLEEVFKGTEKNIRYNRSNFCSSCSGNGSKNGQSLQNCNNCKGTGVVTNVVQTPFGRIQSTNACNVCNGQGNLINEICNDCGGRGIKEKNENIILKIPQGISDGFVYKIESGGNYINSSNSVPGDLIIICQITDDLKYKKFNLDIHRDIFINFLDAIKGNENYVFEYFGEEIRIKIEPDTENGKIYRIKGKGLKSNGQIGDLYLHVNIFIPKNLNKEILDSLGKIQDFLEPSEVELNYENSFLNKSIKVRNLYN